MVLSCDVIWNTCFENYGILRSKSDLVKETDRRNTQSNTLLKYSNKVKYSDCCGVLYDEDIARCKECGEHCGYYEEDEEEWV